MIEFGIAFEQFEFDVTAQSCKEMIGLSGHGLGEWLLQRSILFERLVIGFHVPSFLISRIQLLARRVYGRTGEEPVNV